MIVCKKIVFDESREAIIATKIHTKEFLCEFIVIY